MKMLHRDEIAVSTNMIPNFLCPPNDLYNTIILVKISPNEVYGKITENYMGEGNAWKVSSNPEVPPLRHCLSAHSPAVDWHSNPYFSQAGRHVNKD